MGSGAQGIQPPYHIQKVEGQYELRPVGKLRSWAVSLIRGEYELSERSLGRLQRSIKTLGEEKPEGYQGQLQGLMRSLTGMLETCPPTQKKLVLDTIQAVEDAWPKVQGSDVAQPKREELILPKTREEKLAIAKSIIARAQSGKKEARWPEAFLTGTPDKPSPLTQCFIEYLSQPDLTPKELARVIEAMIKNTDDCYQVLLDAMTNVCKQKTPQPINDALNAVGQRLLPSCVRALQGQNLKGLGRFMKIADRLYGLFINTNTPDAPFGLMDEPVRGFLERLIKDRGLFSITLSHSSRQRLLPDRDAEGKTKEATEWARTCPPPIVHTFDRLAGIQVGKSPVVFDRGKGDLGVSATGKIEQAYLHYKTLMEYLKSEGIGRPEEVATELMLRSSGDLTMNQFFPFFSRITGISAEKTPVPVQQCGECMADVTVIKPDQQMYRFSVEKGKCIIERAFPMQRTGEVEGRSQREFAWVECRTELDPNAMGDQWTEHVTTKPYGVALAEEVRRRALQPGYTQEMAVAEVQKALEDQVYGTGKARLETPSRKAEVGILLKEMNKALGFPLQ
jgi:hypothetical protein